MRPTLVLVLLLSAAACTRWSPQPVTPERAFATAAPQDVAIRLFDDSTHWWRVRQARLQGDSIVGWTKVHGQRQRAAVLSDGVQWVVVREPDKEAIDGLTQLGELVGILGLFELLGLSFPAFR